MNARLTSTAVMARRAEPADSLDYFPTPPWGTRALIRHVLPAVIHPEDPRGWRSAWDPGAGEGHMAIVLAERFAEIYASDIFADGYGFGKQADFLHPDFLWRPADWIIGNPPFNLAAEFVLKALELAHVGVAMLVRAQFLEGQERYQQLFRPRPPVIEALFAERLPMHKGRWVVKGKSATAYCWVVWLVNPPHDRAGRTEKIWIPPCRKALTRPDDWLNFRGCSDLPKDHPAMQRGAPPTTIADVRRELEALL
jgi:hypothetical protein